MLNYIRSSCYEDCIFVRLFRCIENFTVGLTNNQYVLCWADGHQEGDQSTLEVNVLHYLSSIIFQKFVSENG